MTRVTQFMRRPREGAFSIERLFQDIRDAMPRDCSVEVHVCQNFSRGLFPRLQDMWQARRYQGDVNHITGDVHFLAIALSGRKTILTIHDLVSLKRLRGLRRWIVWFAWYWWPIRRCAAIVAISDETKRDLLASLRCDPAKIHVIRNAVSSEFRYRPHDFNENTPRILLVGTGWNKNVDLVSRALVGISCVLTIIGHLSEGQRNRLRHLDINYENGENLTRAELVAEYAKSDMLVFASTFEGFGLPIIEGQAMGLPVVTSDLEPMREVAGGAACLVNPRDCTSVREGVLRVIHDPAYRRQLVTDGLRNAARFDPANVAGQYADLYRRVSILSRQQDISDASYETSD